MNCCALPPTIALGAAVVDEATLRVMVKQMAYTDGWWIERDFARSCAVAFLCAHQHHVPSLDVGRAQVHELPPGIVST